MTDASEHTPGTVADGTVADPAPDPGGFVTVSSRIAYANRWLRLREDIIRRPDGKDGLYGVVERDDFAVIVAIDDQGRLAMVEQYRYPIRQRMLELPMGMWEEDPAADPRDLAAGELAEETGLRASHLAEIGILFQGAGYSTQKGHVFLATGLTQGDSRREATEADMVSRMVRLAEVERLIAEGGITCAVTIAALGIVRARGLLGETR